MISTTARKAARERWPYLVIVAAILLLDRWSKALVHANFEPGEIQPIINGFFDLTYVRNTGIAFGMLSSVSSPAKAILLSGFAVGAAVLVVIYSVRHPARDRILQLSLSLILAGALGNLYDRIVFGYVIDFFYFHAGGYYWPAFNVADSAISLGVILLVIEMFRDEARKPA